MHPDKYTVIIVNGAPGTGKTHLSRRLAKELSLFLLSKDDIKEGLFDVFGADNREQSKKLGGASFDVLFALLERQLEAGVSCIVETAFIPRFNRPRFMALQEKYGYSSFEIYCHAETAVIAERFNRRVTSGERHPVHTDDGAITAQIIQEHLDSGKYGILNLGGTVIELDTTDFGAVDYASLTQMIQNIM